MRVAIWMRCHSMSGHGRRNFVWNITQRSLSDHLYSRSHSWPLSHLTHSPRRVVSVSQSFGKGSIGSSTHDTRHVRWV